MTPPSDPTGALVQALAHAERLMASRPDLAGEQAAEILKAKARKDAA